MCSTTIFTSILLMVFNFAIIFIIGVFMFKRFLQMLRIFLFLFDFCCLFVNCVIFFFSKIIIFIACSLKVHKNVSSLHTSIFFSIPSNVHSLTLNTHREDVQLLLLGMIFRIASAPIYYVNE